MMKSLFTALAALLFCTSIGVADDLEGVAFIKISGYDQLAVVKTADAEMKEVKVGTEITPNMTIVQIAENRVVLEKAGANGPEKLIVHLDKDSNQTIDRMGPVPVPGQ